MHVISICRRLLPPPRQLDLRVQSSSQAHLRKVTGTFGPRSSPRPGSTAWSRSPRRATGLPAGHVTRGATHIDVDDVGAGGAPIAPSTIQCVWHPASCTTCAPAAQLRSATGKWGGPAPGRPRGHFQRQAPPPSLASIGRASSRHLWAPEEPGWRGQYRLSFSLQPTFSSSAAISFLRQAHHPALSILSISWLIKLTHTLDISHNLAVRCSKKHFSPHTVMNPLCFVRHAMAGTTHPPDHSNPSLTSASIPQPSSLPRRTLRAGAGGRKAVPDDRDKTAVIFRIRRLPSSSRRRRGAAGPLHPDDTAMFNAACDGLNHAHRRRRAARRARPRCMPASKRSPARKPDIV